MVSDMNRRRIAPGTAMACERLARIEQRLDVVERKLELT
jgi:hypothetical protein